MKIHVKTTSERASKKGGDECVNVDLFGEKDIMLGRLVFRKDPAHEGKYRLAEDSFFRSPRLSIHAFEKQEDSPLQEVMPYKCLWCPRRATHKDWREIDGTTTSTLECDVCANLDTNYLLERDAKRQRRKQKNKTHSYHCPTCKTTASWTLDDYAEKGSPICGECGDDMELVRK